MRELANGDTLYLSARCTASTFPSTSTSTWSVPLEFLDDEVVLDVVRAVEAPVRRFFPGLTPRMVVCRKRAAGSRGVRLAFWEPCDGEDYSEFAPQTLAARASRSRAQIRGGRRKNDLSLAGIKVDSKTVVRLADGTFLRPAERRVEARHPRPLAPDHRRLEEALDLRQGIVNSMERGDWSRLAPAPLDPWSTVVDDAVYSDSKNGGEPHMVGAIKASKCTGQKQCPGCHLLQPRPRARQQRLPRVGGSARGAAPRHRLPGPAVQENAPRSTTSSAPTATTCAACTTSRRSSRAPPSAPRTRLPSRRASSTTRASCRPYTKGKGNGRRTLTDEEAKSGSKFTRNAPVEDSARVRVLRELLVRHSDKYRDARVKVRWDGSRYRVYLTGDGSTFCKNKGDYHHGSKVYMDVTQGGRRTQLSRACAAGAPRPRGVSAACRAAATRPTPWS